MSDYKILTDNYDRISFLYGKEDSCRQIKRYRNAIESFVKQYGKEPEHIFSVPGRCEISGNHTDHQKGCVLAASINLDSVAMVSKREDNVINLLSEGYEMISLPISEIDNVDLLNIKGTTFALIIGTIEEFKKRNYKVCGFDAYVTSDVLIGSGLSSSASFEILLGNILNGLANEGSISSLTLSEIATESEREYFGKPCGMMDQLACATGGLIYIDFSGDVTINHTDFDPGMYGYSLCITDTKGSHEDLTEDYASISREMSEVAKYLGCEYLSEADFSRFIEEIPNIRARFSDRHILRAMHLFNENERVKKQYACIKDGDFEGFLKLVRESGNSSYKYLQNIYSPKRPKDQNISLALLMSEHVLGEDGACRIQGGGFAGTIEAYVKADKLDEYIKEMNRLFGEGSCREIRIRQEGGVFLI